MGESWAVAWAGGMADPAVRFNPNHASAGSATGGQFASSGGGGSGAKASGKTSAHAAHVAHVAHEKRVGAVAAAAPATAAAAAARKKTLLGQAHADREKAAALGKELKALDAQEARAVKAAAHAKSVAHHAAAVAHMSPAARAAAAKHHAAHKKATVHHASLKSRISGLHDQISALITAAKGLEAQAAKL